jgi:hypothetical protein
VWLGVSGPPQFAIDTRRAGRHCRTTFFAYDELTAVTPSLPELSLRLNSAEMTQIYVVSPAGRRKQSAHLRYGAGGMT